MYKTDILCLENKLQLSNFANILHYLQIFTLYLQQIFTIIRNYLHICYKTTINLLSTPTPACSLTIDLFR